MALVFSIFLVDLWCIVLNHFFTKIIDIMHILLFFLSLTWVACQSSIAQNTFTLKSEHLGGQATLQEVFNGCGGENRSPQISWSNAPKETKSFAITVYDPDAPTGSGWWHWLVVNVPAETDHLPTGAGDPERPQLPEGVIQTLNDYGQSGYGGPCPPEGHGPHQYILTIHALKVEKLDVQPQTNPAVVGFQINANTIAKASLVFYYER